MNITEFYQELETLFVEDEELSKKYIIDRIESQKKSLIDLLRKIDEAELQQLTVQIRTVEDNIRNLYAAIENSIKSFFNGDLATSRDLIFSTFFDRTKRINPLPAKVIPANTIFYRVRSNDTYDLYNEKEMFHIPFEKRKLVSNERYSISGFPSLYLGSSIYDCWEETNRPNIDTCNVVLVYNKLELYVINMSIPEYDGSCFGRMEINSLVLPLVCSLRANSNDNFKPEYIIPQNVLSCIIHRNNEPNENMKFDGIMYNSTVYGKEQCLFKEKKYLKNFVLPIKESKESGWCDKLRDLFEITETTSQTKIRLTEDVATIIERHGIDHGLDSYQCSLLGQLEEKLREKMGL